jgi:thioredoxin reductase (NADPH)
LLLQKRLSEAGIPLLLNTVVKEIRGEKSVNAVLLENVVSKSITDLPADGIFIAAGYVPNSDLAKKLGIETDNEGYIKVNNRQQTSVQGIYAAGDITGGFKQIVTAVGQGSIAANSIFEDIPKPYRQEKT